MTWETTPMVVLIIKKLNDEEVILPFLWMVSITIFLISQMLRKKWKTEGLGDVAINMRPQTCGRQLVIPNVA